MERRTFVKASCACGILSLVNESLFADMSEKTKMQDEKK